MIDSPAFTKFFSGIQGFIPLSNSLFITGVSAEDRSNHPTAWQSGCTNVEFARLVSEDRSKAVFDIDQGKMDVFLRGRKSIRSFLTYREFSCYYLDITGLAHHVWAPLLRGLYDRPEPVFGVYVEPGDYRASDRPTEASIFDLSDRIDGIAPLPGFASFADSAEEETMFVPLLGFEGARFAYMLEALQPNRDDIAPIIGVPGFRPEYPFYSFVGNRSQLIDTRSWKSVQYAAANCPFSLYYVLSKLLQKAPRQRIVVGMIGTKPHALGAVMFYLTHPNQVELVYDYPVRKAQRTHGASRVCVYRLSLLPR